MIVGCMAMHYQLIISGSNLPEAIKAMLASRDPCTLEELDDAYAELVYMLEHERYYNVLAAIEKGEKFLAVQTEPAMIARCQKRLQELQNELESLTPKEMSA